MLSDEHFATGKVVSKHFAFKIEVSLGESVKERDILRIRVVGP